MGRKRDGERNNCLLYASVFQQYRLACRRQSPLHDIYLKEEMKRILVVQPDYGVSDLLSLVLRQEGYEVQVAHLIEEATSTQSKSRYDLLITDACRQSDPYQFDPAFLAELAPIFTNTPIILCSRYPFIDDLRAGDCNLADVLPMPFNIDDLINKVDVC